MKRTNSEFHTTPARRASVAFNSRLYSLEDKEIAARMIQTAWRHRNILDIGDVALRAMQAGLLVSEPANKAEDDESANKTENPKPERSDDDENKGSKGDNGDMTRSERSPFTFSSTMPEKPKQSVSFFGTSSPWENVLGGRLPPGDQTLVSIEKDLGELRHGHKAVVQRLGALEKSFAESHKLLENMNSSMQQLLNASSV